MTIQKPIVEGLTFIETDDFTTYPDQCNQFIIFHYMRSNYNNGLYFSSSSLDDIFEKMDNEKLWDDYYYAYVDQNGIVWYFNY